MAPHSIFSKCFRFARVFSTNGQPTQGLASLFGLQKQLFSTGVILPAGQAECTVSYLVNSCGLSPESAALVSHKVKLRSLDIPNSALALLKLYEFSDAQISEVVRRRPLILVADAKKTILPKLEFLCSVGISRLDLARTLCYNPWILRGSLENHIVPTCSFLKSLGLSDDNVVYLLKHNSFIFSEYLSKSFIPNVELVRKLCMPQSCFARLITVYAKIMMRKPELFSQLVHQVSEMGFDPKKFNFVYAIAALSMKETTWKRCREAYMRWGWSEDHVLSAFRMYPQCMALSEKKLMGTMDFLVNKMGWQSRAVAKYSHVLCYSLEKRIIPRFSVVRVLVLKGLIEEKRLSLATVISPLEKCFLDSSRLNQDFRRCYYVYFHKRENPSSERKGKPDLRLNPRYFGHNLQENLVTQLIKDVNNGTCSQQHGFDVAITGIENIGKGLIVNGTGFVSFPVRYQCVVCRPFKGEILEAVVTMVNKMGFFAEAGPVQIFVSNHLIPDDMEFQCGDMPNYTTSDGSVKIQIDSEVRLKIIGTQVKRTQIFCVGTIKDDFLGVIKDPASV
ncbi:hypothetical protein ACLB2K_015704 [Fragaria x ananassa]